MKNQRFKIEYLFGLLVIVALVVWAAYFNQYKANDNNNLKVYFLNVGQGDSEYIKLPNGKDILIDGGPDNSVLNELGEVMNLGDKEINLVVLTHPHADHLTGLVEVLKRYKIDEVWSSGIQYPSSIYDSFIKEVSQQNIPLKTVKAGDEENWGGIKFFVRYPLTSLENKKIDNVNNASLVTELDDNKFKVLFMGDLEQDAQKQILTQLTNVTVVKVAHHGSVNGSLDAFYQITRPAIAIIEVGVKNTYGHPSPQTIAMLKKYLIQIYRTDQDGRIEIDWDGNKYYRAS